MPHSTQARFKILTPSGTHDGQMTVGCPGGEVETSNWSVHYVQDSEEANST